ncbi:MAG TPA: hypothetical protein DCM86_03055 [Verrucomicrobiales bacterium]|nr:hypothetical protein [Verrucomicrobiales bacterium]
MPLDTNLRPGPGASSRVGSVARLPVRTLLLLVAVLALLPGCGDHKGQDRRIAYYQDSMHPWIKSDHPGKCTICFMDLTPIYEGQAGFASADHVLSLSSNSITVLNVQTEEIHRKTIGRILRVAGTLEANESKKTVLSAPAAGRVESLAVPFAGVEVAEMQPLITFYSPELAQEKRRYVFRARLAAQRGTGAGSRMQEADPYYSDLLATMGGTVTERHVYAGQYVAEGEKLLTIVDASALWFRFDVYERQLPWFQLGQKLEVTLPSIPGRTFTAVVSFLEPVLNDATRSVKVRAEVQNPIVEVNGQKQRLLRYGMYADGRVLAEIPDALAVPRGAVIYPGGQAYTYVAKGGGGFERRKVRLGRQGDDSWEILAGLEEGEKVVTSGNMLIDAQTQFNQQAIFEPASAEEPMEVIPTGPGAGGVARELVGIPAEPMKPGAAMPPKAPAATGRPPEGMAPDMGDHPMPSPAPTPAAGRGTNAPMPGTPASPHRNPRLAPGARLNADGEFHGGRTHEGDLAWVRAEELRSAEIRQRQEEALKGEMLSEVQSHQVVQVLSLADRLSSALSSDNLEAYNKEAAAAPALLAQLPAGIPSPHPWNPLLTRLVTLLPGSAAKDLAEARLQFGPFSTAIVELTRSARKQGGAFAALKLYHCPMAPKPGLWMQAKGPLLNPYFGAKMLNCGEEVK